MKTNAPGKFDCEVYLKAWQLGIRGEDVMEHIDNCWWCAPLIHGSPDEFPLSIEEEADIRIRERRRLRRRAFLRNSAAAVATLSLAGFGAHALFNNPRRLEKQITIDFANLDATHAQVGDAGIASAFDGATPDEKKRTLRWIADRQHVGLYGVLADALFDDEVGVKIVAMSELHRLPAVELKPYLPRFEAAEAVEAEPRVKLLLQRLVSRVQDS